MFPAARVRPPSVTAAMQVADEQVNMRASMHLGKVTGATECVLACISSTQSGGRAGTHQVNMRASTHPGNVTGATECVLARICSPQSGGRAGTHQVNMHASTHPGNVTGATECVLARICSTQSGGRADTHQAKEEVARGPKGQRREAGGNRGSSQRERCELVPGWTGGEDPV